MTHVAAYCRVSTDKGDQANSFESQQRYFRSYIAQRPDWALYQIYADEGISGTSTKRRASFQRMIQDARSGAFRLILTKEVSRFSRNILDTIAYTRELKAMGVGVIFLNDGIDTRDPDAELRLSIMGSLAQEESRRTSSRVKWGQARRMEQGVVFGRSLLGYAVKDGRLTVEPQEAELVRLIFHKYGVEKKGSSVIARELEEAGYRTHRGGAHWSPGHILKLLKNEKYVGDLVQKKTITPDYLTHAKRYNHGEEELVILQDHHEPIIGRDLWELVQAERKRRDRHGAIRGGCSDRYVLSGRIRCGACGAAFVARKRRRKDGSSCRRWSCCTAVRDGTAHLGPQGEAVGCGVGWTLRDETAMDLLRQVLQALELDRGALIRGVTELVLEAAQTGGERASAAALEEGLSRLARKREAALDAFLAQEITRAEMRRMTDRYDQEAAELQARLSAARARAGAAGREELERRVQARAAALVRGEGESTLFWRQILDHMVVYPDRRVEVALAHLSRTWTFLLERPRKAAQNGPSVPMSVSRALSSG